MNVARYSLFVVVIIVSAPLAVAEDAASVCHGTPAKGWLENGIKLPENRPNFKTYSPFMSSVGRTYVHSQVRDIILSAYKALEKEAPGRLFMYAETGWASGGSFYPHKTHRNGLSVDFMVPALDSVGKPLYLPTSAFNRFGYDMEFNGKGEYREGKTLYLIDFEAMGAHLVALDKAAKAAGAGVARVIFDPKLQPRLMATKHGTYLKANLKFNTKQAWVRHDEHYHVDFAVECEK